MRHRLIMALLLLVVAVLIGFPGSAAAQDCPPPGYTLECEAMCGWCEWPTPGNCCRGEMYEEVWYCLLTLDKAGCHDGTDDPCCTGGSLF